MGAEQLAADLARQHAKGRVHRDILPGWILIEEPSGRARLAGWLDRTVEESTRFRTPSYVAHELFRGEPATPASDVFAVGCIWREWLTGRYPFNAGSLMEIISATSRGMVEALPPEVPGPAARLLDAMVSPDPRSRPEDGAALQAELRGL